MIGREFAEYLDEMAKAHRGLVDISIDPASMKIKRLVDPEFPRLGTEEVPNPSPTYRYSFGDGTYIKAVDTSESGTSGESYSILVDTAGREKPPVERGAIPRTVRFRATGGMDRKALAEYEADLADAANDPGVSAADRDRIANELRTVRDDLRALGTGEGKKGKPGTVEHIPGTKIPAAYYDDQGNRHDLTLQEARSMLAGGEGLGGGGAGAGRTRFPSETALDEAQAAYYRARAERERQEMQGKQQQALQDYYEAIKSLETMIGNDTIKPAEADAYMGLFQQNLDAALRGTTPFEESKFKAQETRQRGEVGRDLLNQRLQSSTSLANTLVGLLGSLGGKITEPFKFDPFAAASGFVTEQGGGPGVSGLATSLLQGMAPGAVGGLPVQTAEALPPDLPPELADIYRQVKAMPLATGGA